MAGAATSMSSLKKVVWSWQSNPGPYNDTEQQKWERYSDFEIEAIENSYGQKDTVDLGGCIIDFRRMVQIINEVSRRESPVKREEINRRQYLREERFSYPEEPSELSKSSEPSGPSESSEPFQSAGGWNPEFIIVWQDRFQKLEPNAFFFDETTTTKIVEQAAKGIIPFFPYLFAIRSEITVLCL